MSHGEHLKLKPVVHEFLFLGHRVGQLADQGWEHQNHILKAHRSCPDLGVARTYQCFSKIFYFSIFKPLN